MAKSDDCRQFGYNVFLNDFISELKSLYVNGIELMLDNTMHFIKIGLVAVTGDTLTL